MKKNIIRCITIFSISILLSIFQVFNISADDYSIELEGSGTLSDPYLIKDETNLELLANLVKHGKNLRNMWFALSNNIDCEGKSMDPVSNISLNQSFDGNFDGRGYSISNFVVDSSNGYASFFGNTTGIIKNLTLDGVLDGSVTASFANKVTGTILNCISNSIVNGKDMAAGIANECDGSLQNVVFQGQINSDNYNGIVNYGNGFADHVFSNIIEDNVELSFNHIDDNLGNDDSIEENKIDESKDASYLGSGFKFNSYCNLEDYGYDKSVETINDKSLSFFSELEKRELCQVVNDSGRIVQTNEYVCFEGNGSKYNPYIIDSSVKLVSLIKLLNLGVGFEDSYFYQTVDIDLSAIQWNIHDENATKFAGFYDGNGYSITNLNTQGGLGGLFNTFDGIITNLKLIDCVTANGCGFFGDSGDETYIINSYCTGEFGKPELIEYVNTIGQLVNVYIKGLREPTISDLNDGLHDLVVEYGFHCGDLKKWDESNGELFFTSSYMDDYLNKGRLYWSGNGTENDPYLINSLDDFVYLRESVYYNENFWRYWFAQNADIDFSRVFRWSPISDKTSNNSFYGNYDGRGYQINYFFQRCKSLDSNYSLFGTVRGTIMNLHLANCSLYGVGNGIIAQTLYGTGKIINNVIEIEDESLDSVSSIVMKNSGKIVNNIIITDKPSDFSFSKVDIKSKEAIASTLIKNNIITDSFDTNTINVFNDNISDSASIIKQRITNFNSLEVSDPIRFGEKISLTSDLGLKFAYSLIRTNPLLLFSVLVLIVVSILSIINIIKYLFVHRRIDNNISFQIILLFVYLLLFIVSIIKTKSIPLFYNDSLLTILILTVGVLLLLINMIINKRNNINTLTLNCFRKEDLIIIPALLATAFIVIQHFNIPIAYDSDLYYGSFVQSISNYDFSLLSFLNSYNIASKPMHGIGMFMSIGEALQPGTGKGVYIINLILLLRAQQCLYMIMKKLFKNLSRINIALLSICFSFSGYVIAGATYINPDFYSVVTFVIFVYYYIYGYKILSIFWGFVSITSKPNMIIAYIVFIAMYVIYDMIKKNFSLIKWSPYGLPVAFYLILYFGFNSLNRVGVPESSDNPLVTTLLSRLLQYFGYGFIWMQEVLFIFSIIYIVVKKIKLKFNDNILLMLAIWLACFSQLVIIVVGGSSLQLCPRYLSICAIKNTILLGFFFSVVKFNKKQLKSVITFSFAVLLCVQLYKTIDPLITCTAEKKSDDLYYLVYPWKDQNGNDLAFYNYEYCRDAIDGEKILSQLTNKELININTDSRLGYKTGINNSGIYAVYWDTLKKEKTYVLNENCIRLKTDFISDDIDSRKKTNIDNCVIILRKNTENALRDYFDSIKESEEVGSLIVYRAKS